MAAFQMSTEGVTYLCASLPLLRSTSVSSGASAFEKPPNNGFERTRNGETTASPLNPVLDARMK